MNTDQRSPLHSARGSSPGKFTWRPGAGSRSALSIAVAYLVFAAAWIYYSDQAVEELVPDPAAQETVQTWKGLLFVTITASLLFLLVRRQFRAIQRQAEVAVDLSSRLRLVSDLAGVALVLLDQKHRYLYANPAYLAMFGRTEAEVVGRPVREVWPQTYESDIRPRLERAFRGEPVDELVCVRRPDGAEVHCEAFYRAGVEAGEPVVVLVVVDQTARSKAQEALRRSEAKFQLAFANNAAAIAITRLDDGVVVDVNQTWEQLCGVKREEIVGRSARAMWPSEADAARFVAELKAQGVVRGWEQEFVRPDGSRFVASLTTRLMVQDGQSLILSTLVDLTERRRDAAARSEVEELFRQLFDQIPVAVLYCHRDGRLLRANRRLTELLGYAINDVPTLREWWQLVYPDPDYRAHVQQQWVGDIAQAGKRGGDLPIREYRMRRKDGAERRIDLSAKMVRDEFLIVLQDVTERRAVEEKMRFHERLLEDTGRIAKVGGWTFDVRTGEGYWTNEVARIHDLDPGAPTSKEIGLRFYTPESRGRIERAIQAAVERGESYDLQLEIISAKGVHKWVRTIGHPVAEQGRVTRLAGSFQDITAFRQVEESLRESEERLRQMAENIDEVFWMTDVRKRQLLYVSPTFERVWGRSVKSLFTNPLSWLDAIIPADRERIRSALERQATGGYAEEYRIQRPDGGVRWISDRAYPVRDANGDIYRLVGVARDVTETKQLQDNLLRAQRLEAIGTLASGVAHDLNNILSPILVLTGMLREKEHGPDEQKMLGTVEKAAQRGAAIVSQLLTFSRGLGGERVEHQAQYLVKEVLRLLEETFPRNIQIESHHDPDLPAIVANPTQMHQVLMNLCVNARDAMPDGGQLRLGLRAVDVSPSVARQHENVHPGRFVVLSVADTGVGIPAEVRARIFDPFFTTKPPGKGTGLGLPTVLGIVRNHGGFLEVDSEPGRGTRIQVYLPAARAPQPERSGSTPPMLPAGDGELVLVVDDEEAIRSAITDLLLAHNYRAVAVNSGDAALQAFAEHRATLRLAIVDLMLPDMDGHALTRSLLTAQPSLPIIICSGEVRRAGPGPELDERVRAVLPKPFAGADLLQVVDRALRS
jgi:PAS domain S-box-containing protein